MFGQSSALKQFDALADKAIQAEAIRQQLKRDLEPDLMRARTAVERARNELAGFSSSKPPVEPYMTRDQIKQAEQAHRDREHGLEQAVEQARDLLREKQQTAEALRVEAQALSEDNSIEVIAVTRKDLSAHVKAVDKAAAEVKRLQALIADQESIAGGVDDSALTAARQRYQSVLADLAEGQASE